MRRARVLPFRVRYRASLPQLDGYLKGRGRADRRGGIGRCSSFNESRERSALRSQGRLCEGGCCGRTKAAASPNSQRKAASLTAARARGLS